MRFPHALPAGVVVVERAIAALRAWLVERGEGSDWPIYRATLDVPAIERHACDAPNWEPLSALTSDGSGMSVLATPINGPVAAWQVGVLPLPQHSAVIARWYWLNEHDADTVCLVLIAAPSPTIIARLLEWVRLRSHKASLAVWQILRGSYVDEEPTPRPALSRESIILSDALADRLEREVIGFFTPAVADMYRALGVPHRRGVLLYGPPGNGKTSTVRYLGGRLPGVAALILRPGAGFDSDDLEDAIRTWTSQAPAMLVIEDLNWLLEKIDVSIFLNMLDGIDTPDARGLLLIASTNHPDRLDSALSNRPGRFDLVLEVPLPEEALRLRYLRKHLPSDADAMLVRLAAGADGLSFAHLGEILRISGLAAIADGRAARTADDLFAALSLVRNANANAETGFEVRAPVFGLQTLVRSKSLVLSAE